MRTIVCIGDSLTYGYGVHAKDAWPYIVAKETGITVINRGENGDTTAEMLGRFYDDVILEEPEWVFLMGGTNDVMMGVSVDFVLENISLMIDKAKSAGIKTIIGIPPGIKNRAFKTFTDSLVRYCRSEDLYYVDFEHLYPVRMVLEGFGRLYSDDLHPTKEGHHVMAEIFCEFVKERC